ncbi:phage terminase large subunit [Ruthenibacterium lactatiformans]|uniref:phage terminase large subunit n=1 Tax=Ruthenibacterium lactatiformans TaxID=1550024 RepID=UPI001966FC50|nr:phage terminase large subunit [Ruthenibacterium lactatiformans]MBN2997558.1 phage terminase large subunit [Ruthenibacterium lactatiformans]
MQWDIGKPNPRQIEFFKARARFIAYGGARGGGKSWAVRKKAAGLALSYPGAGILIVRRTFPELRENHILPMTADLAGIARYRDADKSFTFPGGSRIVFGYCSSESDVLQYQGQEYDVIFMDEATQFTEFQFTTLTACLRGANDFPKRFYLTCNPGGVGHAWVKRLFIDRRYKKAEHPEDYVFIAANVYDNHALMAHDPDYVRMLENLPEEQRRAWLLGQWDIFEGQYFAEFDRNVHVCRPYGIPAHWRRYVTLDYGMDMLAYSVRGLRLADGTLLPHAELEALDIDIKIDISPIDPYSVLSRELSLENALAQQHITFEEYVEALDDNSGVPKDKFRAILDRRRGAAPEQSESGAGQNIGPGGAAGAFSPEEALPGMELAGGGVPGGLPGAGMPVQGGAGIFPGMGPAMA